jgi:hypothetical protein
MVPIKGSENVLFICQNPTCRKSFEVIHPPSHAQGRKVRCTCGSEAKKAYVAPAMRKMTNKITE